MIFDEGQLDTSARDKIFKKIKKSTFLCQIAFASHYLPSKVGITYDGRAPNRPNNSPFRVENR